MRIERRFTKEGQSAYADIEFRKATSEISNPDGSIVFQSEDIEVPVRLEPGGVRHPGAEIFPQGRCARAPEEGRRELGSLVAVALGCR
jgi:isopentenyl diphosphate isomerase/L-lactate dehydrogenase-like FMN-dependent dehydrogenase